MGCIHSSGMKNREPNPVETLYLQRKLTKKILNYSQSGKEAPTDVNKEARFENLTRNLYGSDWEFLYQGETEGRLYTKFPRWRGYKMCNICHETGDAVKVTKDVYTKTHLCKRCSLLADIKNNMRSSSPTGVDVKVFTNLLALTALDLSAPASDALVKNRKNAWIQLAGHPGSFAPAGPNTIWKRRITKDNTETKAYESLMKDVAHDVVPIFYREVSYNAEYFIEIEDLLQHFTNPNIMDIKVGRRTFLESEVKNPVLRKDLYQKMISLDPEAPTPVEREQEAITKLRYMTFREQESSTAEFGFRIEALRTSGRPPKTNLKKVKTHEQISNILKKFLDGRDTVRCKLCQRLKYMRKKFESSPYLMSHEMIGSSVLVMFDSNNNAGVWMIDFSKAMKIDEDKTLDHRSLWKLGNHEDGYLYGIDKLIEFFENGDLAIKPPDEATSEPKDDD